MSDTAQSGQDAVKADWVRRVLGVTVSAGAAVPPGAAPAAGGLVAYAKSRLIWLDTRRKVQGEIERLTAALVDAYADEGIGDAIGGLFHRRVGSVMSVLDESLADKLDEASNQVDPALRAALIAEARQIVGQYQAYLAAEPLIAKLDGNPLVSLSIGKTMTASLQAVATAIR